VICIVSISRIVDISPSNLDPSLWVIQPRILHDVLCIKLNKQGDNIQPWYLSYFEPVCGYKSASNSCFLTWIQISQEAGMVVWYSHLFSTVCCDPHRKGFSVVNEAEIDFFFFLELPCFFYHPTDVGNLISGSSAFSKSSLYIWNFSVHVLLKPILKDCEHSQGSMWKKHNYMVVWILFGIVLLWDWNENGPFPVLWPLLSFPNLQAYWVQHFNSVIF